MPTARNKEVTWRDGKPIGPCGKITWYCSCEGWHDKYSCYYDEEKVRRMRDWQVLNANADILDKEYGRLD